MKAVEIVTDEMVKRFSDVYRARVNEAFGRPDTPLKEEALAEAVREGLKAAFQVPEGWRLIKNSTHAERSFPNDGESYRCICFGCHRSFTGHKSRVKCRVCEVYLPVLNPADIERSRAEAKALIDTVLGPNTPDTFNPHGSGPTPIGPREDAA